MLFIVSTLKRGDGGNCYYNHVWHGYMCRAGTEFHAVPEQRVLPVLAGQTRLLRLGRVKRIKASPIMVI